MTKPTVLLSGVTGTFGGWFVRRVLQENWVVRGYSRDEHKQAELADQLALEWPETHVNLRLLIGDVRDLPRLKRAMEGCDVVIHAAALKHVTAGEHNPDEFVKTNVLGTLNVAAAALDCGVKKAVFLSSDKAVHPVNLYGATKLCGEKIWLSAGNLKATDTKFSVVRYGNVKGSRGSVLTKPNPILRDRHATRFWMEPSEAVDLVLLALREMQGGEVFVPKLHASRVSDFLGDVLDAYGHTDTGLLPGEKLHETLIATEEVPRTLDFGNHYRIVPEGYFKIHDGWEGVPEYVTAVPADFTYTSAGAVSEA